MNLQKILKILYDYGKNIGWENVYAKWSHDHRKDQSLLVHSINQCSLIIEFLEHLFDTRFSTDYKIILLCGAFFSDAGKSEKNYQNGIYKKLSDEDIFDEINADAIKKIGNHLEILKKDLVQYLSEINWEKFKKEVLRCVCYHEVSNAKRIIDICGKFGGKSDESRIIDYIDDIASCKNVLEAVNTARRGLDSISHLIKPDIECSFTYHNINKFRGVITTYLNEALIKIHKKFNFVPILYFPEGVLYIDLRKEKEKFEIEKEELLSYLNKKIKSIIKDPLYKENIYNIAFGAANQRAIPVSELLSEDSIRKVLKRNLKNINEKKIKEEREKLKTKAIKEKDKKEALKDLNNELDVFEAMANKFKITLNLLIEKYLAFKTVLVFFGSIIDEIINWIDGYDNNGKQKILDILKQFRFGEDILNVMKAGYPNTAKSFNKLDLNKKIWSLYRLDEEFSGKWLEKKEFNETILNLLIQIALKCFNQYRNLKPMLITNELLDNLLLDINYPKVLSNKKLRDYISNISKKFILDKSDKSSWICFFCQIPTERIAIKDLIGEGPRRFSNQLVGGKRFSDNSCARICSLCYIEAILRKILIGRAPEEMILITPELNLSPELSRKWQEDINIYIENKIRGLSLISLPNLRKAVEKIALNRQSDFKNINNKWLSENLIYSQDNIKKRAKKLHKNLNEEVGINGINDFNLEFETNYKNYREVVKDVFDKKWWNNKLEDYFPHNTTSSYFYRTPNYCIIIRINLEDDNKSIKFLRRLFLGLLLSYVFNCRVNFITNLNPIEDFQFQQIVSLPKTSLTSEIFEYLEINDTINLHNRPKILLKLAKLLAMEALLGSPEKNFLLNYLKSSRGFILNKFNKDLERSKQKKLISILESYKLPQQKIIK